MLVRLDFDKVHNMKELKEMKRVEETNKISDTNNSAPQPYPYKNRMFTQLMKNMKEPRSPKCDDLDKPGWESFIVLDLT